MACDASSSAAHSGPAAKAKAKVSSETNHVFDKTRLCKFFFRGSCDRKDQCTFAHSPAELLPKPSFYKSQLCEDFQRLKSCPNGEDCNFAHGEEELQTPVKNPRVKRTKGKRLRERRSRRKQAEDVSSSSLPELSSSSDIARESFDDRSSECLGKEELGVLQEYTPGFASCHISMDLSDTYWMFPSSGPHSDSETHPFDDHEEEFPTVMLVKNTFLHMQEMNSVQYQKRRSHSQPAGTARARAEHE